MTKTPKPRPTTWSEIRRKAVDLAAERLILDPAAAPSVVRDARVHLAADQPDPQDGARKVERLFTHDAERGWPRGTSCRALGALIAVSLGQSLPRGAEHWYEALDVIASPPEALGAIALTIDADSIEALLEQA